MWRHLASAAVVMAWQISGLGGVAQAQDKFPCEAFVKVGDGSWQAIATALIPGRNFRVQDGSVWRPGATVLGIDLASTLEKECPNAPIGLPQSTAAPGAPAVPIQSQQPEPPRVPLTRYADANGNIDVRRLTCGHLDDASPEEVESLLSWYSGWYSGSAKGRGINLPRVHYAIRSVSDYCKANRDKNLGQVIELMLK